MTTTIHFFAPTLPGYLEDRRDQRVRLISYDDVERTYQVEFPDGYRILARKEDIVSREA